MKGGERTLAEVSPSYRVHGFIVDPARWELRDAHGARVEIAPLPFRLLLFLIEQRERVVSKDELLATLWDGAAVNEGSLTQAISIVRRALGGGEVAARSIQNVRGRGYRFTVEVEVLGEPESARPSSAGVASRVFPAVTADELGRGTELARIEPALEGALAGRGAAVLISGRAGIGKTWLAGEIAARMAARGALRCEARGYEDQGAPPMWALRQLALALTRGADRLHLESEHAAELRVLVPELAADRRAAVSEPLRAPTEQRFFVFSALLALLQRASQRQPIAIVLEDLHWVDEPTLLFLARLAPELQRLPVLLLCTYRDAAPPALELAAAALSSDSATVPLQLEGLAAPAVRSLLAAHGVTDPSPALLERALQLTQGNPLFVMQLARWLAAEGQAACTDPAQLTLPEASRAVLRRQVSTLPEATQRCLELAAALGDDFHLGELQQAAALPHDALLAQLEPAYAARLLVRDSQQGLRRRFGHPSIRTAIYEAIDERQRLQLHLRVAEALARIAADSGARLNAIAHHYHEAAPLGVTEPAVRYGWLAAQASFNATAYEDTLGHCRRILSLLQLGGDDSTRCDAELLLGHALRLGGGAIAAVREAFSAAAATARRLGDGERFAQAALAFCGRGPRGFGVLRTIGTVDPREIELLEMALSCLRAGDSPTRALVMSWLSLSLYNADQPKRKAELTRDAVAMARRTGDLATLVECLFTAQMAERGPEQERRRMADLREAIELAGKVNLHALALDAGEELAWTLFESGDVAAAELQMHRVVRRAEALGRPQDRRKETRFRVMRLDAAGRFADADALLEAARAETSWPPEHVQTTAIRLFMLQYLRGNAAQTIAQLEAMAQRFPLPVAWHCGLVSTYASIGRFDDSRRTLERLALDDFAAIPDDHNRVSSLVNLAFGATTLRELPACARLRDKLTPFAERNVIVGIHGYYYGTVVRVLGLLDIALGDHDRALSRLEQAARRDREMGAVVYEAWDLLGMAEAELARGARDSRAIADRLIAQAMRLVRGLPPMPPLLEMADRLCGPSAPHGVRPAS